MAAQSEAVHLLLQRARTELTLPRQRAFAAVVGAAVADAAAVRCHWQYDAEALRAALAGREPLFAEEAQNPFYRVAAGRNSCYGDQLRCVVASLARTRGAFDGDDVAAALRERMTAPDYEASTATRNERAAYRDDQRAAAPPLEGPWRHGTIQRFLDGAVDDADASADALLRAIPVAARAAVDGKGDDEVAAVADAAAVSADAVAVAIASARRRRLTDTLTISYTITVASESAATALAADLGALDTSDFDAAIQTAAASAGVSSAFSTAATTSAPAPSTGKMSPSGTVTPDDDGTVDAASAAAAAIWAAGAAAVGLLL